MSLFGNPVAVVLESTVAEVTRTVASHAAAIFPGVNGSMKSFIWLSCSWSVVTGGLGSPLGRKTIYRNVRETPIL
jgi:hypothetical protein